MGQLYQLEEVLKSAFDDQGIDGVPGFDARQDFDLGLEIALLWVDKLCEHLSAPKERGAILQSVKTVFSRDCLLLILLAENGAEIVYNDLPVPRELCASLCRGDEFYGKLARIRFTRFFGRDSLELNSLPPEHPLVRKLLAVPVFFEGVPAGCLALASDNDGDFGTTHAMVLSLAASILSLAKTIDELKEELSLRRT